MDYDELRDELEKLREKIILSPPGNYIEVLTYCSAWFNEEIVRFEQDEE